MSERIKTAAWHAGGGEWTREGAESLAAELHIDKVAPGAHELEISWRDRPVFSAGRIEDETIAHDGQPESGKIVQTVNLQDGRAIVHGLKDGTPYTVRLVRERTDGEAAERVGPARLFRTGAVPGTVVNYIHPDDYTYGFSGRSTASPSIAKLPDGRLVVSHDVFWGGGGQNLSLIFRSDDDGCSWSFVTYLYPCFWGKLFVHRGELYMLATSTEYGELLIGKSVDGGETWTPPVALLDGGDRPTGGPHKAPMPVIEYEGRLWTSIDYGSWSSGGHRTGLISVPADADLLDRASWTAAPFLPYEPSWPGAVQGGTLPNLLEGNALVAPDGRLAVLPRYQTHGGTPNYGKAVLLYADASRPEAGLTFAKVIDFHGNASKFTILFDPPSGYYWSLVNRVSSSSPAQRNILTLVRSRDTEHWDIVADILDYEHNGWPEDKSKVGFQYVDWLIDGDDLLFVSRTAMHEAYNYHNANYITFHRLPQFRSL